MDDTKRTELLKLGFFPVTDDFWYGADMSWVVGKGFSWAFRTPLSKNQPFMPFSEEHLSEMPIENAQRSADRMLLGKR